MQVFLKVCTTQVHPVRVPTYPFLLTPFALRDALKHSASLLMYSILSYLTTAGPRAVALGSPGPENVVQTEKAPPERTRARSRSSL